MIRFINFNWKKCCLIFFVSASSLASTGCVPVVSLWLDNKSEYNLKIAYRGGGIELKKQESSLLLDMEDFRPPFDLEIDFYQEGTYCYTLPIITETGFTQMRRLNEVIIRLRIGPGKKIWVYHIDERGEMLFQKRMQPLGYPVSPELCFINNWQN